MQSFGEALSAAMLERGDSQMVASRRAGLSQAAISKYVTSPSRVPDLPTAAKLSGVYPVLILWLARYIQENGFGEPS